MQKEQNRRIMARNTNPENGTIIRVGSEPKHGEQKSGSWEQKDGKWEHKKNGVIKADRVEQKNDNYEHKTGGS